MYCSFQGKLVLITPESFQSLDDLICYPIVVNNLETCPYRTTLLNWWNTHHLDLAKIIELDTVDGIINTLSLGGGISLLPLKLIKRDYAINTFFLNELQCTSIHIWSAQEKSSKECSSFISIVKESLVDKIDDE
ncbi:LysR substrate-binding domain-containing protein [Candidatus Stoquefichus massiliensis]|uniref:LysR substrate-binding domain-containing protein n=1 Tax=Candidatus Stoquefichus massiliensis TaxID=1470350 RepID=UPI000480D043|nr:LysR substrate-binding domain-containing protein [Candidatus Stoquefichus massiliensis]